ncbi:class I SAM-dependent methyltransferase [Pseudomonas aeruginosa]|nr:class I SAM-dependent methyltransferase [Pseudomonas aeruginosa]
MKEADHDIQTIEFYNKNLNSYSESTCNLNLSDQLNTFTNLLPPQGRILDIGCGIGRDILYFQSLGFVTDGIEPSILMARVARKKTRAQIIEISAEELNDKDKYDGIWACASLLHIPKRKIESVINKIAQALKKEGYCYISLKEGIGEVRESDGRLFSYYTAEEITKSINRSGSMGLLKIWKSSDAVQRSNTQWLNILLIKSKHS